MTEGLRYATPEEVAKIAIGGDITTDSVVLAMSNNDKEPDLAVIRRCVELDPVIFSPDTGTARRARFIWAIENYLRLQGVPEYYFDVHQSASDAWVTAIKKLGATKISTELQNRYRKIL